MKRLWAAAACAATVGCVAACGRAEGPSQSPSPASAAANPVVGEASPADAADPASAPAVRAAAGAPAFVVLYPGGALEGEPVLATGPAGPGGLVTYVAEAQPEEVIAFHRQKAEAAGLSSVMAMNQGEARAYGAAGDRTNLQVVASPMTGGRTSVQLSWSAAG